jgi:hypothetical protein
MSVGQLTILVTVVAVQKVGVQEQAPMFVKERKTPCN